MSTMHLSLIVLALLGIAAQVSQVSAVACASNADCKATDFTLATCTANVCACTAGYVATEEGCAKKNAKPKVTTQGYTNQAIASKSVTLTCEGAVSTGATSTYAWYDNTGTKLASPTTQTYTIAAGLTTDSSYECQIVSTTPALSSEKSDKLTITIVTSTSNAVPVITLASPKVADTKDFTVTCSGGPFGATTEIKDHTGTALPAPTIPVAGTATATQVTDPKGKMLTCTFSSAGVTFTPASGTLAYPALATVVESVTITSTPAITADAAFEKASAPTLNCETIPGADYLPATPVVTYTWEGPSPAVTTYQWVISKTDTKVYSAITCTANTKKSAVFHKITVDDDFLAEPTIAQTPKTPVVGGRVSLTCTVAATVTGAVYSWTKNGAVIVGQVDKTIQYTELTSAATPPTFTCTATKDGFSKTSAVLTLTVSATLATPEITGEKGAPEITGEKEVGKWGDLSLVCGSDSETAGMTYEWKRDTKKINKATSKTYRVKDVTEKYKGDYVCTTKFGTLTADSAKIEVEVIDAGQKCNKDSECDAAPLTGKCDTDKGRCVCASGYYAAGSECANGVSQAAGSLLVVFAAALVSRLF